MFKILLLGSSGMFGHCLFEILRRYKNIYCVGIARNVYNEDDTISFDIHNFEGLKDIILDFNPEIIINCIGIIKQKIGSIPCEEFLYVNSVFPNILSFFCKDRGIKLLHISSDCVFSGIKGNYREVDCPDPIDIYGTTKFLGEINDGFNITIRTSIIGREYKNKLGLFEWFVSNKNKSVRGFKRCIFSGLTNKELSYVLVDYIIPNIKDVSGMYHISTDPISKFDLLNIINIEFNLGIRLIEDFSVSCDRSLNSDKFKREFLYKPKSFSDMIKDIK